MVRERRRASVTVPDEAREQEIAALIEPGLRANAWRRDFENLRRRRLWNEDYQDADIDLLHHTFGDLRQRHILDIGAGRGGLSVALRLAGYPAIALDLRRRNCRVARLRAHRYALDLPVIRARAEFLPIASDVVDLVICRDVLEHVDGPDAMLAEVYRVLRHGGGCFVTVINRFCWIDPHYRLAGLSFLPRGLAERYIAWRGRAKVSGRDRQRVSDMHYYTYGAFVRLARRLGFAVDDATTRDGRAGPLRRLRDALLRPVSLHATHFDLFLWKGARA